MKKLNFIKRSDDRHWVGDGFPVRTIFSYHDLAEEMSPFLLLDYAGPVKFDPTTHKRGVGEHPHRGFETVTIVYDGQVEHRDSSGGGGKIGPGDVQWMTAASGLVHEEFHGSDFAKTGGAFEMIQLWVNLPAKDKMSKPGYQNIEDRHIPRIALPLDAGFVRVIAGEYNENKGPARIFSPINVWDVQANSGHVTRFSAPEGFNASLLVMKGSVRLPSGETVSANELAVLERAGSDVQFEAVENSQLLVLMGKPLDEPVVGHGPFVMNTEAEIKQAFADFQSGRMGQLVERV